MDDDGLIEGEVKPSASNSFASCSTSSPTLPQGPARNALPTEIPSSSRVDVPTGMGFALNSYTARDNRQKYRGTSRQSRIDRFDFDNDGLIDRSLINVHRQHSHRSNRSGVSASRNRNHDKGAGISDNYLAFIDITFNSVSFIGLTALSHPFIVLRRQCQVMPTNSAYHLTPISLLPVVYNLYRTQDVSCLWKGIGCQFALHGARAFILRLLQDSATDAKEDSSSSGSSLLKNIMTHTMSHMLITPLYAAAIVNSVQSAAASDCTGTIDCLRDSCTRVLQLLQPLSTTSSSIIGRSSSSSSSGSISNSLLPCWKLLLPIAAAGVCSYTIQSLAAYAVSRSTDRYHNSHNSANFHLYDRYYPQLLTTFIGSLLTDLLLFPLETITHRLCVQGTKSLIDNMDTGIGVVAVGCKQTGLVQTVLASVQDDSAISLYRGFGALLMQYGCHLCLLRAARVMCQQFNASADAQHHHDGDDAALLQYEIHSFGRNSPISDHDDFSS